MEKFTLAQALLEYRKRACLSTTKMAYKLLLSLREYNLLETGVKQLTYFEVMGIARLILWRDLIRNDGYRGESIEYILDSPEY